MYVCVCRGITDGDIRQAVEEGCESLNELKAETGIAMQCGTCERLAELEFRMAKSNWEASAHRQIARNNPLPIVSQGHFGSIPAK